MKLQTARDLDALFWVLVLVLLSLGGAMCRTWIAVPEQDEADHPALTHGAAVVRAR